MSARVDLGFSDEEFYDLTYREFEALWERWTMRRWQDEYLLGCVASAIYGTGFARPKEVPKPGDFCFAPKPGEPPRKQRVQTRQEIADVFRSLMRPGKGKENG